MYPFSIKNTIPIYDIEPDVIHRELMRGINGRKIKRIKRNQYTVQEPTNYFVFNESFTMVHDLTLSAKEITITSSSGFALGLPSFVTLGLLILFYNEVTKHNDWNFVILGIIPITWMILPIPFYLSYLLFIPSIKDLRKRFSRIQNSA